MMHIENLCFEFKTWGFYGKNEMPCITCVRTKPKVSYFVFADVGLFIGSQDEKVLMWLL